MKNYIFDFGGVLYEIDPEAAIRALSELSIKPDIFKSFNIYSYLNNEINLKFEKGLISPEVFIKKLREEFFLETGDKSLINAFNKTLVKLKSEAVKVCRDFKKMGKLILLSNSNLIHYKHFSKESAELFSLFDKIYFSFHHKMRKPEIQFYELVLNEMNLNPEETLFIDDSEQNIKTANYLGINTFLFNPLNDLSVVRDILN